MTESTTFEITNSSFNYSTVETVTDEHHTHLSEKGSIMLIIFMTSLAFSGTILNLLVIIVYRKKRSQYASIYLIFVLALVDLIVSSLVVPFTLLTYFPLFRKADLLCGFVYFSRYSTSSLSVCLLGLIAIERYHTITTRSIIPISTIQLTLIRNSKIATIIVTVICLSYALGCFFIYQNIDDTKGCGDRDHLNSRIYNIVCISVLFLILIGLIVLYIKTYIIVKQSRNRVFLSNTLGKEATNKEATIENTPSGFNSIKTKPVSLNASRVFSRKQQHHHQQQSTNSPNKIAISTISSLMKANEKLLKNKSTLNQPSLTEPNSITNTTTRNNYIFNVISNAYLNETTNNLPLKVYEYQTESIEIPSTHSISTRTRQVTCFNTKENNPVLTIYNNSNRDDVIQTKISNFDTFSQFIDSKSIRTDDNNENKRFQLETISNTDDIITEKLANFYSKVFTKQQQQQQQQQQQYDNDMSMNVLPRRSISTTNLAFHRRASRKQSIRLNNTNMHIRKDWRVARMFALVTAAFVITWIPWCLITLELMNYNIIIINTYFLNNAINPIIYSFLSKSFRKEAKFLLFSLFETLKNIKKKQNKGRSIIKFFCSMLSIAANNI